MIGSARRPTTHTSLAIHLCVWIDLGHLLHPVA